MNRIAWALIVVGLVSATGSDVRTQEKSPSDIAFERLKSLLGTWEVQEKSSTRKTTFTYVMTGRGSVLIEEAGGMSTAYHLDKGTLMLTHFCGAGNQPRLRLKSVDNGGRHIVFEFYDITNHPNPDSYYTNSLDVLFHDDGSVDLAYGGMTAGRQSAQVFQLLRKTSSPTSLQ